ncbi:restriction endonuclease subunit S [Facklamia hominis]|uniref:Restriction endonuclease subunit S n=2 Tax=Facklamia hominis TaxID=178214 RepID=A0AAJ1V359_9LACT|nr:restriction endonuclease subunit S [Facklamia hominis]MDK7187006.1 restriction endonuclease subunit S [Facklamia hominis]
MKSEESWGRLDMKFKLSDVMELIGGGTPKTSKVEYWNGEIPWLSVKDFNNDFRYVYETEKSITELGLNNSSTKLLKEGDIIISARGTVGEIATIPFPMAFNQSCYGLRAKEEVVTSDYLYYLIKHNVYILKKNTHGSVFDTITRDTFSGIEVDIPSLDEQRKIASILSEIDEKIELNNEINKNLEAQAQAIFKAWFVDFELFDNKRPNDWITSTLGTVSVMSAGGDKPKNVSQTKTDLFQYPIYSNGLSDEGLYGFTDKPKIVEESVTVSARGTIGFVCLRHIPYVPIVRLVTLVPKAEIISAKYLYLYLKQVHITGTGTTQQQLTVPDFQKTEILVPTQKIMSQFTDILEPIFKKLWANQIENEEMSSLRDTLLPKLMSGEIDVANIDL